MMTERQIDKTMAELHDGIRSLDIWDALWLMGVQAKQAMELAAENERLKAKLDAVRAACEQSLQSSRGLSAKLSVLRLLAIIDKDGDET